MKVITLVMLTIRLKEDFTKLKKS